MECQGLGRIFGHKYKARISYGSPELPLFKNIETSVYGMQEVLESCRPITYHYDICTRCGHIIGEKPDDDL